MFPSNDPASKIFTKEDLADPEIKDLYEQINNFFGRDNSNCEIICTNIRVNDKDSFKDVDEIEYRRKFLNNRNNLKEEERNAKK